MRVLEARAFRGPNPYGYRPVIRFKLDLEQLEQHPTSELADFTDRLLELMPTLHEHGCSYGEPGGFVRRLREGTWLGHVSEHIALELQCLAGTPVTYGKTRGAGEGEGIYYVVYSYIEEHVGLLAGRLALRLVNHLLPTELQGVQGLELLTPDHGLAATSPDAPFDYQAELEELIVLAQRLALGPTTQSLVDEACQRGIPAIRLDEQSLVQLGYGKYQHRIRASVTSRTSNIAVETASDKELTNRLLDDVGLPVPRNMLVRSAEEAVAAAERFGYPVVTKPLDVSHGRGVSLNLQDAEQVRWGYEQAAQYRSAVLVETFLQGKDYRVLVVNEQVVAVAERVPAHVQGDGQHTIAELVEITNQDPRRGIGHEKVLTRITINEQAQRLLQQAGYTADTVLQPGEIFHLRSTANISTGGTAIDRTSDIHYDNIEIARRAARVVGLDIAGIDIITPNIGESLREVGGGIVEVNAGPGFRMHLQPSEGTPRNVARPVINMLFPPNTPARIPIVSITGTNGKTTTARMVAHMLKLHGLRVGLTTTDGIYIDGELYMRGDLTGPWSARMALKDPTIEAAVLETARGGILREGLGFDRCDVGAVLNIQADHLGLRGVETLEDLARVKSLVVEVVDKHGTSVLNADDPLTVAMRERAEGRIAYFSMHGGDNGPEHLREHIAEGGIAVVLQSGVKGQMIAIYHAEQYIPLLWTHLIPATLEGKARVNVANALAATAIAYALDVPVETIRQALRTFTTSFYQTPGRLNIFDEYPFRVIMDYGHNPAALEHMVDLVAKLRPSYNRVIGVVSGPGDRRDEDLVKLGELAGRMFDEVIIKQDASLRGRPSAQAAGLVRQGVLSTGFAEARITTVLPELEAVDEALGRATAGDLVVIFADQVTPVWKRIIYFGRPEVQNQAV
ncbi:MAG: cyanophycin synthetase [Chloroflexota bacterium]|nr:cyanophycin synthetase [Chloroflexota bacterium]